MSAVHTPSDTLSIRLFDDLCITLNGKGIERFRSQPGAWLFAYLVLHPNRPVIREDLAGIIWPGRSSEAQLKNLRRHLTDIRHCLGPAKERVITTNETVLLNLSGAVVDVYQFDEAIKQSGDTLTQAVALYTSPILPKCEQAWMDIERSSRDAAYLEALVSLAKQRQRQTLHAEAIKYLRLRLRDDPSHEEAACMLMESLRDIGDYEGAINTFRTLRAWLRTYHNAVPEKAVLELYLDICAAQRQQQKRFERERAALNQVSQPTGSVPQPLAELIGRDEDVRESIAALERGRLVTLTGCGGIGKTQIALKVAHRVWPNYPDGVWFVSLAHVQSSDQILSEIGAVLQLPEKARTSEKNLASFLDEKRMLLVLDNCEHLLPGIARTVRKIRENCPEVSMLATSRQKFGQTGEIVRQVLGLALPPPFGLAAWKSCAASLISESLDCGAVSLFVDRVSRLVAGFTLTAENAQRVVKTCEALEGIPLAIELAAAWVPGLSLAQIEIGLQNRFSLLTEGDLSGIPHHTSLRLAIDWSYDLLSLEEQTIWRQVSVFVESWTIKAAEQVCNPEAGSPIESVLTRLMDRSIIMRSEESGEWRYRMLETLREYGEEKRRAIPDEDNTIRKRHLSCFLQVAVEAKPRFASLEQSVILRALERDRSNLHHAIERAIETCSVVDGLTLCTAIWRYWHMKGEYFIGYTYLTDLLKLAGPIDAELRLNALAAAGSLALFRGDYLSARKLYVEQLAVARRETQKHSEAAALGSIGLVDSYEGNFRSAQTRFLQSLSLFQSLDNPLGIARSLGNLAMNSVRLDDYLMACDYHTQSIPMFRSLGNKQDLALALLNLAESLILNQDARAALVPLMEGLEISVDLASRRLIAQSHFLILWLSVIHSKWLAAATLIGIHDALRDGSEIPFPERARDLFASFCEQVTAHITTDEYEAELFRGRRLLIPECIAYVRESGKRLDQSLNH